MDGLRTWLELDTFQYIYNLRQIKNLIGETKLAVVLKSNAYGHGMIELAKISDVIDFVEYICTSGTKEALQLRYSGIKKPIVVLSYLDDSHEKAILNKVDLCVYDLNVANEISQAAIKLGIEANIHIKIDTGMTRFGVNYQDALEFIKKVKNLPFINIKGIFTHLCDTDSHDVLFTQNQINCFDKVLDSLDAEKIAIPYSHVLASGALSFETKRKYTMVRVGGLIYGMYKSELHKKRILSKDLSIRLKTILTWKTRIFQIKIVPADTYIGYNRAFKTNKMTRVAILPIGYVDGFPRAFSNNGFVFINNKKASILGIVSMNVFTVDITNIPEARINDEVILLGNIEGIRPEDLAIKSETINNEITTRINSNIPRVFVPIEASSEQLSNNTGIERHL